MGGGARQPGMTGQVKEEILARWGELGVSIQDGALHFSPTLLQPDEFLPLSSDFTYVDSSGETKTVSLPPYSLAFTFCQTPVIYTRGDSAKIAVTFADGRSAVKTGTRLDVATSQKIFGRDRQVQTVHVTSEVGGYLQVSAQTLQRADLLERNLDESQMFPPNVGT